MTTELKIVPEQADKLGARFSVSLERSIAQSVATLQALEQIETAVDDASDLILATLMAGGKILIGGNGGSASTARYFAAELARCREDTRRAMPAIAIGTDTTLVTHSGAEYDLDALFVRPLEALAQEGDLAIFISASGHAPNLIAGFRAARERGLRCISLLGCCTNELGTCADVEVIVPGMNPRSAQEAHLFLVHHFCDQVDEVFG